MRIGLVQEKNYIEEYKLILLFALQHILSFKDKNDADQNEKKSAVTRLQQEREKAEQANKSSFIRWLLFVFSIGLEIGTMLFAGVVFAKHALEFLPFALPEPLSKIFTLIINGVECTINYCFKAPVIKSWLGIKSDKSVRAYSHANLVDEVTEVGKILDDDRYVKNMKAAQYKTYSDFMQKKVFKNIAFTNKNYHGYNEKLLVKGTRLFMTGLNIIQSSSGAWFFGKSIILLAAFYFYGWVLPRKVC